MCSHLCLLIVHVQIPFLVVCLFVLARYICVMFSPCSLGRVVPISLQSQQLHGDSDGRVRSTATATATATAATTTTLPAAAAATHPVLDVLGLTSSTPLPLAPERQNWPAVRALFCGHTLHTSCYHRTGIHW